MKRTRRWLLPVGIAGIGLLLAGCPGDVIGDVEYDLGYAEGFLQDDWYWEGFDDSMDTVDGGPIYYEGSDIPYIDDYSYDAGYWDGVWVAYNDGYFVSYDYAFTIGFSEGYDLFYHQDWPFLLNGDEHIEWLDGGFTDGYNDGFSEGRIFGAYDYENNIAFDWLGAMLDYRDGIDVEVGNPPVGTGEFGPVFLYEYGTDPNELIKGGSGKSLRNIEHKLSIRQEAGKQLEDEMVRPLTADRRALYDRRPATSPRIDAPIELTSTWLERIQEYQSAAGVKRGPSARVAAD
jgi:hypothetical protein